MKDQALVQRLVLEYGESRMARVAPSEQEQPYMSPAVAAFQLQTVATQQDQDDQEELTDTSRGVDSAYSIRSKQH